MESYNSTQCRDGVFGPGVWTEGCRGGFDFTLTFEESILSMTPAAVFLLLAGPRSFYLLKVPDRAKRRATYTPKLASPASRLLCLLLSNYIQISSIVYSVLQLTLLALVASKKRLNTNFSLAAAILNLLAAFAIVILAHFEHVKSIRPSFLLSAYLFVSLLFDAARLRTEWLLSVNVAYAAVISTSTVFKLALLILETIEKRKILIKASKAPSAESTSGPFSRGLFVWLNSLLISGWGTSLTNNGLPAIYEKLSSDKLAIRFGTAWSKGAMVRGGLITLIYGKMMKLPTTDLNESSAVALMGNDVETLTEKLHVLLVESWANTLTVGIAMYMLADQLGAVCVAPIITAIIKMLGLTERFRDLVAQKRDEELAVGIHYRWVSVYSNCITNCNISLTEAITFGAYAIAAKLSGSESFSASQAITALSILSVMMEPLSHLVGNIPHSFSAFGCFKRIQEFLLLEERIDSREIRGVVNENTSPKPPKGQGRVLQEAIARAVYSRKPVAIFDDVFSGLDKVTEQAVFTQVFGKNGLLSKNGVTVILATHAGKFRTDITLKKILLIYSNVWVTWWGNGRGHNNGDLGYWLSTYAVLSLLEGVLITMAIAFSQDLRYVDMVLPLALSVFLFEITACIGAAGLAIAAVSWFAISIPFVVATLVLIQRFYVRTSKQLRVLEIEHKAPLFSHFLESINGLATIRAFGWVQPYADKNLTRLDDAQKPAYLLNCIQRWLTLVLDLVVAFLTIILVVFAVTLREKVNPSLLGVALVNMMRLGGNMKGIILYWSILETSLGAITRIRSFSEKTPTELEPGEDRQLMDNWPARGTLEVNNLSVQYDIKHGEKLGVCGRSGSGKSSLVQALLRMADVVDGQITLDGEDLTKVPRPIIRERLSCLTQDPFLFSDSIRFNTDPVGKYSDEAIVKALARVGIWSVIKTKVGEDKNPLDEKMDENFLSHGQRQLFCLARALLKKGSLLILDEPTSSVDSQTDARIQEVIRSEFSDCTIIMIAHRLDTLLDFDKIAVLDRGSLVEFGAPQELLANETGAFARLYRADQTKKSRQDDI
ncbi:hypothetical protein G7Z17_g5969 [Cylindrodendrum hubeiense]|uniref:Uncharacterized protein n=1 Tax=Cylindrodendrum hubeiense TaxID=595255 RepID=A0A9P5HB25_9HYPO|nr:hypothetical protein G7Z17_g5969 [Cylindrodendrum hubeiense]